MKIILMFILLFQAAAFMSCEKELMEYEGREGVYFAVQHGDSNRSPESWPYQPYTNVDFVRIGLEEVEIPIKIAITGPVKDYDRVFFVDVNPDSTTAILHQHYEAIAREWVIPARAVSTTVKVRLKRTPDLEEEPKTLGLRLTGSDDLALAFPEWDAIPSLDGGATVEEFDASLHTLRINDIMVEPEIWRGTIRNGNLESGLFGAFTRKKMEFLIENLDLTYEDFASEESMPLARSLLIGSDASKILIERYNAGDPILEDDGRLMFIGSVPWTSYIGVPWVPGP